MDEFDTYLKNYFGVRRDELTPEQLQSLKAAFDSKYNTNEDLTEEEQKRIQEIASHMFNRQTKDFQRSVGIEEPEDIHTSRL